MSFRFKLSTPLRMREIAEDREERLLTQILNKIAELRVEISAVQRQQVELTARREESLRRRVSASELQMQYAQKRSMEEAEERLQQQLAECELLREQQQRVFQLAHQDREVLSELRKRELDAFQKVQARRDQQTMDDSFMARRRAD